MKFEIKNRWSGEVQYTCELSAEVAGKEYGPQLGFAVKKALAEGANLRAANLSDANLSGANLRDLREAYIAWPRKVKDCPVIIPDIHKAVYAAASQPKALDMASWHACETTHCRAGWVVALAGDAGRALEFACGTPMAATLIYAASDPNMERVPDFYASNEAALADMAKLAGVAP